MRNRKLIQFVFAVFAVAALTGGAAFGQIRVIAQVDTSQDIYVGESFTYQIVIDGHDRVAALGLKALSRFNPQNAGGGNTSKSSVVINNGKMTHTETKQYVMNYTLTVNEAGRFEIPSITATVDGEKYQTNAVAINVIEPGETDQLELEVEFSESRCYVGQPVVVTVKFYVSTDIGDFQFNIPAFTGGDFYLEDTDSIHPQAKQYRLAGGARVFVTQHRVRRSGKDSILLKFSKILIPKRSGLIKLEPSTVSADVAVGRARSRDGGFGNFFRPRKSYKRFMVSSDAADLEILALPQTGRPSEFYGLVGRYQISASAEPTKVNVGDPITLTIKIGGGRFLKPVRWPELEAVDELADNFKIPSQKSTPSSENGFKVFTQTIRASNDKVTRIPPIPLAYFDVEAGRYELAETEPIELEVAPTKILTSADLEGMDFAPVNKEVEAIKRGLSANYEGLDVLDDMGFSPLAALVSPGYMAVWLLPLSVVVLSFLVKVFGNASEEQILRRRMRRACGNAVRDLRNINSDDLEELVSIMQGYLGDRFDKVAASLTCDDCGQLVFGKTGDEQLAKRYKEIIAHCQQSRYAAGHAGSDTVKSDEVIELIGAIEKKLKR